MTYTARINISSGRRTVVTESGDEIDVIEFVSDMVKQDLSLVVCAMHTAYGTSVSEVNKMLEG